MTIYVRRTIGACICLSPLALSAASIVKSYGANHADFTAVAFAVGAFALGALNFYLSFIRLWWINRRRGSLDGISNVSGIPMVGTLLVLASMLFGFGSFGTSVIALCSVLLDTGGASWFLVATWHDKSLWGAS